MKKLLFIAVLAAFTYLGSFAQTTPGNSAYGQSHKKAKKAKKIKKAKKPYTNTVSQRNDAQRKAINVQHKTAIKTIKDNDALTNQQQKDMVKQANTTHKTAMKTLSTTPKGRK